MNNLTILCLTGFTGAGKTTVANLIKEKYPFSYDVLTTGDIPRKILIEREIEPTHENLQKITKELVKKYGNNFISILFKNFIPSEKRIIIDSIRRPEDLESLSSLFTNIKILSILCDDEIRYKRLRARKRIADPNSINDFKNMDLIESKWGIQLLISKSDYSIDNNGSISELYLNFDKIINLI